MEGEGEGEGERVREGEGGRESFQLHSQISSYYLGRPGSLKANHHLKDNHDAEAW